MDLRSHLIGDTRIVSVPAEFDAATVASLRPAIETLAGEERCDTVFDMSGVSFIDSSGVGTIVFLFKRLSNGGRTFALSGLSGQPKQLIEFLRIDRVIDIREDLESGAQEQAA